jgi:hypothetical protein
MQYLYSADTPVFFGDLLKNKMRKYEALYRSNIDYYATYDACCGDPRVADIDQTEKGLIYIEFKGLENVLTLISPQGIVQIFYSTLAELSACLSLLRSILAPKSGEKLYLEPLGRYILVDQIRCLIQEGKINHDMSLDLGKLAELTGWQEEDIRDVLPTILQEKFPFGVELKVSNMVAGCSRPEHYIEEWLESVRQAFMKEGFQSPCSYQWKENQSFELVKHISVGANYEAAMRVRAFLDGIVVAEAQPKHLTNFANAMLHSVFDKYGIPYETEAHKMVKNPFIEVVILGIAILGIFSLCRFGRSSTTA